jgi:hypothetical protein
MGRPEYVLVVLAMSLAGCAANDARPPSPARNLRPQETLAISAPPNERYYLMIFGSQTTPKVPRFVHSWATVVKVTDQPDCPPTIEQHTISWMPETLRIKPCRFRVEKGANLDLHFTIEEVLRQKERVSMWGPYEIWHGLYRRFLLQEEFMNSG